MSDDHHVGEKEASSSPPADAPLKPTRRSKGQKRGRVPRPSTSRTSPKAILAAKRRREALQLRLQSYSYNQIAEHLKISDTQVQRDIERALQETVQEPAQKVFAMEMHRLDELAQAFYMNAVEGDIPSAQMLLRVMEQRGRMLGFFDREHVAKFGLKITEGGGEGGAPREMALEFILPGNRVLDMARLGKAPSPRTVVSTPAVSTPKPQRIQPSPDDIVLNRVQPSAFSKGRGGFNWS
jgi:hypothetical protein